MFTQQPTPQDIVNAKLQANSDIWDIKQSIDFTNAKILHTSNADEISELHDELQEHRNELAEQQKIVSTPVNLSETKLEGSLILLELSESGVEEGQNYFHEDDLKTNLFSYVGEFKHVDHHVMVIGMKTGKIYPMVHSYLFDITMRHDF